MSVQHVVLFSFPSDLDELDWTEMRRQVHSWPVEIGGMTTLRLGPSINAERTRGYQYLLFMEFPEETALTMYQQHPVHQTFLRWVLDRECTALAFDYFIDQGTVIDC